MKTALITPALLFILAALPSCGETGETDTQDTDARRLYQDLRAVYRLYADSLAAVSDTADIDSMIMRLDDRVRKIYARYPADLDIHIPEAENDSLWVTVSRIAEKRNRVRHALPADTIPADSVPDTAPETE